MANSKARRGLRSKISRALHAIPRLGGKVHDRLKNHHCRELHSTSPLIYVTSEDESAITYMSETTARYSLPALPTEVWERIIDWLVIGYTPATGTTYHDNLGLRRDLSSGALVCRAWRVRAQMHLFAFLRITGNGLSQYEALILSAPILCTFAKELIFFNQYVDSPKNKVVNKTVETASHAVRIAHKLSNVRYLLMDDINLAIEHPQLHKHITGLTNINKLDFYSPIPTKLSQLARILVGLKSLSSLFLDIPIIVDSNPLPLPTPCYSTKSSLTRLDLVIQPGGNLLVDWLVKAKSFTTSLQILWVMLEDQIPQSEIAPVMQCVHILLDNCTESLKEWHFRAKNPVNDLSTAPKASLESHKSLSKLELRVSKTWLRHGLGQLTSIISKHITEIWFVYWLNEEEEPCNEFWEELDMILQADIFKTLTRVNVACLYEDSDRSWHHTENFDKTQFPTLLPAAFKKGILTW